MVRIKVGVFSVRADAFSNPVQNRWLLVEFLPVDDGALVLSEKTIWAAVKQSVVHNFGDAGWGGIGVSLSGKLSFSVDWNCGRIVSPIRVLAFGLNHLLICSTQ